MKTSLHESFFDSYSSKDLDVIVLSRSDPEYIKKLLESANDRFFLLPSANPRRSHHLLWYSLPGGGACKIDILTPGLVNIPYIPTWRIVYQDPFPDIPVAPFLCLLLLKLGGWSDHRDPSKRRYMPDRVPVDEEDIEGLLTLAIEAYDVHLMWEEWMPGWFVALARDRVEEYVDEWPETADSWSQIGFSVH